MNNSSIIQIKAVIWKETKEFFRSAKLYAIFTIIFVVVIQIMSSNQIIGNDKLTIGIKQVLLGYSIIYLSLMSIPFFGCTLLSRIIYEERCDNAIHVLLATGVDAKIIWFGKMITTYIISYLVFICSVIVYYISIYILFDFKLVLSAKIISLAFLVMPILAFGVMSLMGYIYWALKNPQIIGMLFPMLFVMAVWNLAMKLSEELPTSNIILGSMAVGAVLIISSAFLVGLISKQRITNV